MENYKVLKTLGKSGRGSVYLVENKTEKTQYVLKRVECLDESEANKAYHEKFQGVKEEDGASLVMVPLWRDISLFHRGSRPLWYILFLCTLKEALALQTLEHPYVCGYKEFFVMWDKQVCSMYVCIVMDYCRKGDLGTIISQHRERKIPIPEERVKKFLGEILDALIFIHKQRVIHRNLKPSNIFVKDDGCLCLGDFGVSTIMKDLRTCPRNTEGTTAYMAPEAMEQAFEERSDVWSLGCILLELTTTAILDQKQIIAKLIEVKKDSYPLEEIFEQIPENFSDVWIKMIRTMLKVKHEARPNAEGLVKVSFVSDCVETCNSSTLDKRRRQQATAAKKRPLLEGLDDPYHILAYIAETIDHAECVRQGLQALQLLMNSLTSPSEGQSTPQPTLILDQASRNLISVAMWDNLSDKAVQIAGCAILSAQVIMSAADDDVLFSPEVLTIVNKLMKEHRGSSDVQQSAAALILTLSANAYASNVLCKLGAVRNILTAMQDDPQNASLIATCCNALWSLSAQECNIQLTAQDDAVRDVCLAVENHLNCVEVIEAAASAMFALGLNDNCFDIVNSLDTVGCLLKALQIHIKNAKVVRNISLALTTLVEPNEECAYRILTNERPDDSNVEGIPTIMQAYELHRDNADVVETLVGLIMELCEYDDVKSAMQFFQVGPNMLVEIVRLYKMNPGIMRPCEQALEKLGTSKMLLSSDSDQWFEEEPLSSTTHESGRAVRDGASRTVSDESTGLEGVDGIESAKTISCESTALERVGGVDAARTVSDESAGLEQMDGVEMAKTISDESTAFLNVDEVEVSRTLSAESIAFERADRVEAARTVARTASDEFTVLERVDGIESAKTISTESTVPERVERTEAARTASDESTGLERVDGIETARTLSAESTALERVERAEAARTSDDSPGLKRVDGVVAARTIPGEAARAVAGEAARAVAGESTGEERVEGGEAVKSASDESLELQGEDDVEAARTVSSESTMLETADVVDEEVEMARVLSGNLQEDITQRAEQDSVP